MSQMKKRREEREKEIGMLGKGQCVESFFLHARRLRELRNAALRLSLYFRALMFISGEVGLEQVTHDAQRREGGRQSTKA